MWKTQKDIVNEGSASRWPSSSTVHCADGGKANIKLVIWDPYVKLSNSHSLTTPLDERRRDLWISFDADEVFVPDLSPPYVKQAVPIVPVVYRRRVYSSPDVKLHASERTLSLEPGYRRILEIAESVNEPIDLPTGEAFLRRHRGDVYTTHCDEPNDAMFAITVLKQAASESESPQAFLEMLLVPPRLGILRRRPMVVVSTAVALTLVSLLCIAALILSSFNPELAFLEAVLNVLTAIVALAIVGGLIQALSRVLGIDDW